MKTIEFIEEMHSLGYVTKETKREVSIRDINGIFCATVSTRVLGKFSTEYKGFTELETQKKLRLLNLLIKYSKTPIKEREEENKFMLKQKGLIEKYLEWDSELKRYTTGSLLLAREKGVFTQSEIDEMPECYTHPSVWEMVKVGSED